MKILTLIHISRACLLKCIKAYNHLYLCLYAQLYCSILKD